jgi:protein pelota
MISKIIDGNSISVIPEDPDDLFNLRRIIKEGDTVVGDTTRVIKQDKDYSRPDKGERIRVKIALTVEKISLDDVLDRLRIGGTIFESSNELVPHGSHHSFILKVNDAITITKKNWLSIEKNLIKSKNNQTGFLLVAIDTGDCGIARLQGTHLQFVPNIYSGSGGKIENTSEYLAIFKTTNKNKKILKEKIKSTHPYDVPEIVEIEVLSINKPYLDWLVNSTT